MNFFYNLFFILFFYNSIEGSLFFLPRSSSYEEFIKLNYSFLLYRRLI